MFSENILSHSSGAIPANIPARCMIRFVAIVPAMAGLMFSAMPGVAKETLKHHGTFRAWHVFSLNNSSQDEPAKDRMAQRICYAATRASHYHPRTQARDRPTLYIVRYPKATTKNTVEMRFGGDISEFQSVTAKLIARRRPKRDTFSLTTKKAAGFIAKDTDQTALIAAMTKGRQLIVVSQPGQGQVLEDRYSMFGFTKALAKLEAICPSPLQEQTLSSDAASIDKKTPRPKYAPKNPDGAPDGAPDRAKEQVK